MFVCHVFKVALLSLHMAFPLFVDCGSVDCMQPAFGHSPFLIRSVTQQQQQWLEWFSTSPRNLLMFGRVFEYHIPCSVKSNVRLTQRFVPVVAYIP